MTNRKMRRTAQISSYVIFLVAYIYIYLNAGEGRWELLWCVSLGISLSYLLIIVDDASD